MSGRASLLALTRASPSDRLWAYVLATSGAASGLGMAWRNDRISKASLDPQSASTDIMQDAFRIEVDLMDKLAAKSYLNPSSSSPQKHRPKGVPRRIRILALDVPEMRQQAFDGECRVTLHKIFGDGTAPPKRITTSHKRPNGSNLPESLKKDEYGVLQKSLATALTKCRAHTSKRIGVELLEGSVANLNPHNMRKTHQFGSLYRFDPGKYSTAPAPSRTDDTSDTDREKGAPDRTEGGQHETSQKQSRSVNKETDNGQMVLATEEDELDAPWHQYAWIQELQLRIHGRVDFREPMQPASRLSRLLYGSVYKCTVPSQRSFYEWFLPPFFHSDPAGTDGSPKTTQNWASQKPHAVIADGAAMQRVPGSLRFLQRTCEDANVPLYIIHDPRVWGGNTHQDMTEALRDMRRTIKHNVVTQAMMQVGSFSRGRLLGQVETEARWQAKDIGRRTRQAVKDANEKLQRERENDWSKLDTAALQEKLVQHRAIVIKRGKEGKSNKSNKNKSGPSTTHGEKDELEGTPALMELARRCVSERENKDDDHDTSETAKAVERGDMTPVAPPAVQT